jgi:hypothetical protein
LPVTIARHHCPSPLPVTIARHHCPSPLPATIACHHCLPPLPATIAPHYCPAPPIGFAGARFLILLLLPHPCDGVQVVRESGGAAGLAAVASGFAQRESQVASYV